VQVRSIGHASIGAAIASNWMSAASFLGIAGVFFLNGYFAFAYILGWTGRLTLSKPVMILQWPVSFRQSLPSSFP
jgi:cation/acetate symporter